MSRSIQPQVSSDPRSHPVAIFGKTLAVLLVNNTCRPKAPRTVALGKSKPGELTYASTASGRRAISTELFSRLAGLKAVHVLIEWSGRP
jgi:hypothetical protein